MRTAGTTPTRKVSEPVELARIEALIDRAVRVPGAYLGVSRVGADRRQEKLCTFDERRDGRIVVDLDRLRREQPGVLVRFQLRENGQVLGTAQWHIPERGEDEAELDGDRGALPPPPMSVVTNAGELQRTREDLAGARAEVRHLAEEVRRLRSELAAEQAARHRAEAECDGAKRTVERLREGRESLLGELREAAVERKESEIAFRLLLDRVPEEVREISRLVGGG